MELTKKQEEQKQLYEAETGFDVMDSSEDFDECLRNSVDWFEGWSGDVMLRISGLGQEEV